MEDIACILPSNSTNRSCAFTYKKGSNVLWLTAPDVRASSLATIAWFTCWDEEDSPTSTCLQALDRLIGLLEGEREYTAAIGLAQRLLRLDPLHEATY